MGANATYRTHAAGLAVLLSYRTAAIAQNNGEVDDTVEKLSTFYITDPLNQCQYCRTTQDKPKSPPKDYDTDEDAFGRDAATRGLTLKEMRRRGLLSEAMDTFIEPAMIWSTLAERAKKDKLSAAIGATHAWIDEGEFTLKGPIHYLDTAVHVSVRLCFYLSSWLDWQHSCSAVSRLANAVYLSLGHADIDALLVQCPDALLWMALMAGPLAEGEAREWFSQLLLDSIKALAMTLRPEELTFESRVSTFNREFVWSSTMTEGADMFWEEVIEGLLISTNIYEHDNNLDNDNTLDDTNFDETNYEETNFDEPNYAGNNFDESNFADFEGFGGQRVYEI